MSSAGKTFSTANSRWLLARQPHPAAAQSDSYCNQRPGQCSQSRNHQQPTNEQGPRTQGKIRNARKLPSPLKLKRERGPFIHIATIKLPKGGAENRAMGLSIHQQATTSRNAFATIMLTVHQSTSRPTALIKYLSS